MSRWIGGLMLAAITALVIGAAGCGGGDNGPTTVSTADLHQDGAFWLSLEPSLRRELATICHDRQVKEGPTEGAEIMQGLDVDDYVALITREYEEQGDASASDIEEACEEAKQELLAEQFNQLVPHLRGE